MYDNNMIMSLKQKKRKFEPRIKLNHNIDIHVTFIFHVFINVYFFRILFGRLKAE